MLATLATERTDALRRRRRALNAAALNSGYHLAYLIGAALMVVAIGVALTVIKRDELPAAEESQGEGEQVAAEPAYREAA